MGSGASRLEGDPAPARPGAPLPGVLRSPLERYLNASLAPVRVHAGPESRSAADGMNARAFTLGQDIHLGTEGVRASGPERNALLAHEAVHTLQQGLVAPAAKPRIGAAGDAFERQADRLAAGFSRFERNPRDPVALRLRDSAAIRRLPGTTPTAQCSRVATHYGEFEDYRYQNLTDSAGTEVGVEMYLKFHPGTNVRADLIGLTQAAEGRSNGTQITQGIFGQRSATSGPGVGSFIDRIEGFPNPLYPTTTTVRAGGSASNLADYETTAITPLTSAQQTALAASSGVTGRRYQGWGRHGYRKVVAGSFVTQPAELYDAPVLGGAGANSEQVFETTALAIAGVQSGTYYGSVEWGWRKDAAGAFSRLPLRVVSQAVPSVTFLTAASIWNPARASFGFVATSATNLLDGSLSTIAAIPVNAELTPTGRQGAVGGVTYFEVTYGGNTGVVASTAVRATTIGAATVDLPVPMVYTVSNPAGTTLTLLTPVPSLTPGGASGTTVPLPAGTRVTVRRCMVPTAALPHHYDVEVVDGPHTGTRGYVSHPDLTFEALGTR